MSNTVARRAAQVLLEEPRFQNGKAMIVAGFTQRFHGPEVRNISALWKCFAPFIGKVPDQVGQIAYGLCSNMVKSPFSFEYMAGVEVSKADGLPQDFSVTNIRVTRYAIFTHHGQISSLSRTIDAIYHRWLPSSGHSFLPPVSHVPYLIERYDERFNPQTACGDVELWIPIRD